MTLACSWIGFIRYDGYYGESPQNILSVFCRKGSHLRKLWQKFHFAGEISLKRHLLKLLLPSYPRVCESNEWF